ncbi:hypothetical protein GJ496_006339 [Pomphorhynchus laevis]|nr:hypothetical protein GJ496_006339 [Pomphorhynchus laevis]
MSNKHDRDLREDSKTKHIKPMFGLWEISECDNRNINEAIKDNNGYKMSMNAANDTLNSKKYNSTSFQTSSLDQSALDTKHYTDQHLRVTSEDHDFSCSNNGRDEVNRVSTTMEYLLWPFSTSASGNEFSFFRAFVLINSCVISLYLMYRLSRK